MDFKVENKDVTAEWARKTATAILGEKAEKQLSDCLVRIKGAVSRNEMSVTVNIYAEQVVIKELIQRGFKVNQEDDQRDGSYLRISW